MKLSEFNYSLPKELIAQKPVEKRDESRLMIVGKSLDIGTPSLKYSNNLIEHRHFHNIIEFFNKGDVLVINNTRVLPFKFVGKKDTGGRIEMILERLINPEMYYNNNCLNKKIRYECRLKSTNIVMNNILTFKKEKKEVKATVVGKKNDRFIIELDRNYSFDELSEVGEMPLPPYIKNYKGNPEKYQTVYSEYKDINWKRKGSVAAPTAGLHFTDELLEKIRAKGVKVAAICLHISFGTFLPVRKYDDITKHRMEYEEYFIDEKNAEIINSVKRFNNKIKKQAGSDMPNKRKLFVVGTTSMRTLETIADNNGIVKAGKGKTNLFIYPGYKFKMKIDGFITNFHLPKSTLIMLVSAFFGKEDILHAYSVAVKERYRLFSFGDAMLLLKRN
ncbi:MAG: tRNA preQ1(34) S-adenosylmethionine ribosyltransferase-isomerase QueA [Candidatus Woesearchaeota archaeon]